ncbi:MAG: SDR family NAD(P)-dependent oxidoreductase [Cyclobacteriaceae bacterium]|nr:SDR family NAD(P)-dependent oxidoreductase [Cyclobacteriaceae bacterium]
MNKGKYDNPLKATLKGISDLYSKKAPSIHLPTDTDLTGKTVMITGASSGLGYAAAIRLAKAGAKVIMAVRSGIPERGEAVKKLSGNEQVFMYHVDLLDFKSINSFIMMLSEDGVQLDLLISNAAMVPLKSRKTPQGLEEMFMVNYLAPFHLINRLLEKEIIKTPGSRIIIVSSESHRNPDGFDWENFGKYHEYGIGETVARYGYFKLFLTTFGCELSRRLKTGNKDIAVKLLCPGPVNSNIAREAPGWMQPLLRGVFSIFFKSPEKASDPVVYFATAPAEEIAKIPYLFLMQPKPMDEKATSPENGRLLWGKSEKIIKELGYLDTQK